MRKKSAFLAIAFLTVAFQLFAQTGAEKILGKWKAEDETVVEFLTSDNGIIIRQISAIKEKDRKDNGKQVGKDVMLSADDRFKGIVIDPSDKKEYKAEWIISKDGHNVTMKVKWGFIVHSETWTRQ
jgi:uncharacterized protein (DUF2147 family)